jgi:hypothetical protein
MPDFSAAIIVAAGSLPCLPNGLWRRRAGEVVRAMRARRVADAGAGSRAFRPAFFFISAEDSGTVLEGTIILRARSTLFG